MESYVHKWIFKTKANIYHEAFSLWLNHILKMYLIRLNCLQVPFFKQLILLWKSYNSENFGSKTLLLTIEQFLFSKLEITKWNSVIDKEGFLNQYLLKVRSSCPEVFCKKGVLRNFQELTGKHLYQSFFFNIVADLGPATL